MKKWTVIFAMAVGFISCQEELQSYVVEKRTLNEAVYASGEIFPAEYELITSIDRERILNILVAEGDSVKIGDVVAVLGTESENRQLALLSQEVAIARENTKESEAILSELQSKIQLARVMHHQDSINTIRYNELAKEGAVSMSKAEDIFLQAEVSQTNLVNLQQQYTSLKTDLQRKLLNSQQELASLKKFHETKVLISNLNGKVYSVIMKEGELVKPDEPIILLGSSREFILELLVDERDINKIELGQKVYFETDAFPEMQFEAEVSKIVPVLQKVNRSFEVEAKVLSNEDFYPQSSVEANILIRENFRALVIPTDFLLAEDSVFLEEAEKKVEICPGIRNEEWLEVKVGLSAGDIIVKKPQ